MVMYMCRILISAVQVLLVAAQAENCEPSIISLAPPPWMNQESQSHVTELRVMVLMDHHHRYRYRYRY
jgi:hypothetical protein